MGGSKGKPIKGPSRKRSSGHTLHIVSDATGSLARHIITAVLTQFPGLTFRERYHTFQRDRAAIGRTLRSFRADGRTVVFYALIDTENKQRLAGACRQKGIPAFDLTGSLVQFITDRTGVRPVNELSCLHTMDAGYFRRIEAMEFTGQHDDSRRLDSIAQADIVIVGLSRVSKSPTSTFLGSMRYKVANVSITREAGFPVELSGVRKKIVAFTANPAALQRIRERRFTEFKERLDRAGRAPLDYYDPRGIVQEVVWAEEVYRRRRYRVLNTSDLTIEEIAARVLKLLKIERQDRLYI